METVVNESGPSESGRHADTPAPRPIHVSNQLRQYSGAARHVRRSILPLSPQEHRCSLMTASSASARRDDHHHPAGRDPRPQHRPLPTGDESCGSRLHQRDLRRRRPDQAPLLHALRKACSDFRRTSTNSSRSGLKPSAPPSKPPQAASPVTRPPTQLGTPSGSLGLLALLLLPMVAGGRLAPRLVRVLHELGHGAVGLVHDLPPRRRCRRAGTHREPWTEPRHADALAGRRLASLRGCVMPVVIYFLLDPSLPTSPRHKRCLHRSIIPSICGYQRVNLPHE